jgi:light-regulated signal transduction histidine kinase (bacteriophytochrome)
MLNTELAFQNIEKKSERKELLIANGRLVFSYISSHDLQEPLRKIQTFSGRIFVESMTVICNGEILLNVRSFQCPYANAYQ